MGQRKSGGGSARAGALDGGGAGGEEREAAEREAEGIRVARGGRALGEGDADRVRAASCREGSAERGQRPRGEMDDALRPNPELDHPSSCLRELVFGAGHRFFLSFWRLRVSLGMS